MTVEKVPFAFNLPYNQPSSYWLAIFSNSDNQFFHKELSNLGINKLGAVYTTKLDKSWSNGWQNISSIIKKHNLQNEIEVALIASDKQPDANEFLFIKKSPDSMDKIVDSLWLGQAIIDDSIICYMQPVIDKRNKVFGYEAFARIETSEGVIGGGKIIAASRDLNAEYLLDRYLHLKAIKSFISSDLEGFLFINLLPGFIHRPEKYLEGLADYAKYNGMPAKQLVLDFTRSEISSDINQLKAIFEYANQKGYSFSLDDISSVAVAKRIFEAIHPDFIKLDINLVKTALVAKEQSTINELVAIAHSFGVTVLAEGVESKEIHNELLKSGVDLFQGYYFSPPMAISQLKKAIS